MIKKAMSKGKRSGKWFAWHFIDQNKVKRGALKSLELIQSSQLSSRASITARPDSYDPSNRDDGGCLP
jgi:hypothetical protein